MTEHLRFEIADRIATITLDRPERIHARTYEMIDAWAAALLLSLQNDAVRLVGAAKRLELFWTADFIDAAEAERIGLVNKVLPDGELMPYVHAVAMKIAHAPALSVRLIKRAVQQGLRNDLRTNLDLISSHY